MEPKPQLKSATVVEQILIEFDLTHALKASYVRSGPFRALDDFKQECTVTRERYQAPRRDFAEANAYTLGSVPVYDLGVAFLDVWKDCLADLMLGGKHQLEELGGASCGTYSKDYILSKNNVAWSQIDVYLAKTEPVRRQGGVQWDQDGCRHGSRCIGHQSPEVFSLISPLPVFQLVSRGLRSPHSRFGASVHVN